MVLSLIGNIIAFVGLILIVASWTYLYQWAHQDPKTALSHLMEKGLLFIGLALIVIALLFF
jgi:hypothetical protein